MNEKREEKEKKSILEIVIVLITLLMMWAVYYVDQHNCPYEWFQYVALMFMIIVCVAFPAYWVAIHEREGMKGLLITKDKLPLTLLLAVVLTVWRGIELIPFLQNPTKNVIITLMFNGLCIWEVFFIYSWMYTRYCKFFGKRPACILTALSVGLYHAGSFPLKNILYLMLCIFICAVCISFTQNILTLWPLYWIAGCSASTLAGGKEFPEEIVVLAGFVLGIQIVCLVVVGWKSSHLARSEVKQG